MFQVMYDGRAARADLGWMGGSLGAETPPQKFYQQLQCNCILYTHVWGIKN